MLGQSSRTQRCWQNCSIKLKGRQKKEFPLGRNEYLVTFMNSVRGRCTNAALSPFPRLYSTVTLSKRETSPRIHPSGTTGRSIKTADRPSERFEFEFQSIRFDRIAILSANKRETRWNWPFWRTVSGNAKWFLIFSSDTWTYKGVRGSLSSLSLSMLALDRVESMLFPSLALVSFWIFPQKYIWWMLVYRHDGGSLLCLREILNRRDFLCTRTDDGVFQSLGGRG